MLVGQKHLQRPQRSGAWPPHQGGAFLFGDQIDSIVIVVPQYQLSDEVVQDAHNNLLAFVHNREFSHTMSSATKTIEHMKILTEMGNGLLARLYHFKGTIISKKKPPCLSDVEISKIRSKLEKKFPQLPETNKLQGWDAFAEYAPNIAAELTDSFELLMDIVDFTLLAKQSLKDITLTIVDFKLSRNRNLILIYFDLLVSYIRALKMLELIEDRLSIASLYTAAYNLLPDCDRALSAMRGAKLKTLLADCAELSRHFIDFFTPSLVFIKPILLQLKDSVSLMDHCETLRKDYVLNPINEAENMSLPTLKLLNASTPVAICTELLSLEKYYEYVSYAFIAYPALLFQDACLDVLKVVTNGRLVVELYRDISLNIHMELDRVSQVFPNTTDNLAAMQLPKGFKLKNLLKTVSRSSVASAGLLQKERRSFLEAELSNLNKLVAAVPGLLGPKLPMFLATAALAKSELVAYFRHAEGVVVRKDSKQHYVAAQYYAEDISVLMSEIHTATTLLHKHRDIVSAYYSEFLGNNDLKMVRKLVGACGAGLDSIKVYTDAVLAALESVKGKTAVPAAGELDGCRLDWDRALAASSSQVMSQAVRAIAAPFDALAQRMLFVYDRSLYRDSLDRLIDQYLDFHQIGWFRATFLSSFSVAMTDPAGLSRNSWLYFLPLQHIRKSCHAECPEEVLELSSKAGVVANTMMTDLGTFVVTLVKFLWDQMSSLQAQYHPIEVGKRIERIMQSKQRGGGAAAAAAAAQEALPGCESEVWAKKQIEKFVLIQQHLAWLISAARARGPFTVHNLQYNPEVYLQEQILQYFSSRLHGLFQNTEQAPLRFSHTFRRLISGCMAIQHVLRQLDVDIGSAVQDLFFQEFQDSTQVPPPGLPVPLYVDLDKEKLIYKLGSWFLEVVKQIAHSGSGLVWSPSQQMFVNATHQGVSSEFAVEVFLNKDELIQLVTMVGVQGVRAIEAQLLTFLADELLVATKFIGDNKNYLRQFENNYCLILNAAVNVHKNEAVFDALRTIGVVLLVRDMLHSAMNVCYSLRLGDMQSVLRDAVTSLDFYSEPQLGASLACLAGDLGIPSDERDMALCSALLRLNLSTDKEVLQLLPPMAAALFVCDKWEKSLYLPTHAAFENNEHCIQLALSKLFSSFFVLASLTQDDSGPSDPLSGSILGTYHSGGQSEGAEGLQKVAKRLIVRDKYKQYVERYLRISAQTILVQRENEVKQKGQAQVPHRCMSIALEYFVTLCPVVQRGTLEKYLPNYLVHADQVDVTLGRQKTSDPLRAFSHLSAAQAEAHDQY